MNHQKKKSPLLLILLVVFLLAAVADGVFLFSRYTWAGGGFRPRGAEMLDLRGENLTLEKYADLHAKMPETVILWDVPFSWGKVASDTEVLTAPTLTAFDIAQLSQLPWLREVHSTVCQDYSALAAFSSNHPGCVVTCGSSGDGMLRAESLSASQVAEQLAFLPGTHTVEFSGILPGKEELAQLRGAYPNVTFRCRTSIGGREVAADTEQLNLSGTKLSYDELDLLLARVPGLHTVELDDCGLKTQELISLAESYPACNLVFQVSIGGKTFRTDAEEIDISDYKVSGPEEIEQLLPAFSNLKKVVMCRCGLNDETMDALNRRHADVRFVWSIWVKNVELRTDITWFYPWKYERDMVVTSKDITALRYCEDIECIDIGHMFEVTDCEFVRNMPKLRYLIIGETGITDISPLAELKNLVYLEMFTLKVTDLSPLLECTALEDLNLGLTYGDPKVIAEMTWLKNLWWCDANGRGGRADAVTAMCNALRPNTQVQIYIEHPTASGWRQIPNYYAMRDFLDMFYLP